MRHSTRQSRLLRSGTIAGVAAGLLILAGCASEPPQVPPPVTVTPTVDVTRSTPPVPAVPIVWPLTGVETDSLPDRPAVAVKIENSSLARPQTGLNDADVVWETIVDFDVSRLVAVYHSKTPSGIGPIRSVRPMDMAIVAPLHSPLVYSGGQSGILALVPKAGIQGMNNDYGAAGMYRVSFRRAPHNVYGDVPVFIKKADAKHNQAPPQQFAFARKAEQATAAISGKATAKISMRLSTLAHPAWSWSATGGWQRWEGTKEALTDKTKRIEAVNVVLVVAKHPPSGYTAQNHASVPTYDLVGEGEALVATGGKTLAVTWHKADQNSPMQLLTADGQPVLLAPGNTWVELVPKGTGSFSLS